MTEQLRAPIDTARLAGLAGGWQLSAVAETGSTNADLLASAAAGAPDRTVLVAELQTGGRGRLDREWTSPAGAGLTFSLLLRPVPPPSSWGWLPLLAGLALCRTVAADARLKWPNDLLLASLDGADGKVAGILAQAASGPHPAVVIGVGLNVSTRADELPVPSATSLQLQGIPALDRAVLLADFLTCFGGLIDRWQARGGDAEAAGLAGEYRASCTTVGQRVQLELPGRQVFGAAIDVDPSGRLVVRPDGGGPDLAVAAGDVTHVRPVSR